MRQSATRLVADQEEELREHFLLAAEKAEQLTHPDAIHCIVAQLLARRAGGLLFLGLLQSLM